MPAYNQKSIWERSTITQGAENGPIDPNHIKKKQLFLFTDSSGSPPEADLGAIWRRKRSKDTFSSIQDNCLVDFGRIVYHFPEIFDVVFQDFDAILT